MKVRDYLFNTLGEERIKKLIEEEHHSPRIIIDLLRRDYEFKDEFSFKQIYCFITKNYKFENKKSISQPQWFKLQYKYPRDWTREQIQQDISKKAREGQRKTVAIRNKKGNVGNPKFKREDSPLCIEFYLVRGFNEEFAKEKINEICLAGALANCRRSKKFSTEQKLEKILIEKGIDFKSQFEIKLLPEETLYNKRSYIYDFYLPSRHLLIECNGLYWHASPEIYKSGDIIKLPRFGEVLVDKIWAIDAHKKQTAEKRGYKVLTIWEGKESEFTV